METPAKTVLVVTEVDDESAASRAGVKVGLELGRVGHVDQLLHVATKEATQSAERRTPRRNASENGRARHGDPERPRGAGEMTSDEKIQSSKYGHESTLTRARETKVPEPD